MIKIWQSYSCNNSSAYRLVARFADAARAKAVAFELAGLLDEFDTHDGGFQALAQLYGLPWDDQGWGGPEDGPFVLSDDTTLFVHHDYCLGFGPGVPAYLRERGAVEVGEESWSDLHVSVLFRSSPDPRLAAELDALSALLVDNPERTVTQFEAPWVKQGTSGKLAMFRDAGTVGLFFPIDARDVEHLRAWFAERGIEPVMRVEDYADQDLFVALAAARCRSCDAALEYLDPRLHDIETPQLVCKACGGLYDLATFT